MIEWKVALQVNVKQYQVQRKTSTGNFETIKTIPAKGNSSDAITYQFVDNQPFYGDNYYRIRSEDISGEQSFSTTVKATLKTLQFTISPNPVKDKLTIRFADYIGGKYQLRLVNSQGQTCYSSTFDDNAAMAVKTISLPVSVRSGTYVIQLLSKGSVVANEEILVVR